jgi:hypothetical protein
VRHLLSLAALTVLPFTAAAQTQAPSAQPGKMSLPTGKVFSGGFSRPVFQSGFAHPIYPNGFSRMASGSGPSTGIRSSRGPTPIAEPLIQAAADSRARQADAAAGSRTSAPDMSGQRSRADDLPMGMGTSLPAAVRGADMPAGASMQESSGALANRNELISKIAEAATPPPPPRDRCCCSRSNVISTAAAVRAARDTHLQQMDTHLVANEDRRFPSVHPETHMADNAMASKPAPQEAAVGSAPAAAADSLREHLQSDPDDFHAMRLLAVSLLNSKRPQEAAKTMAKAYESDPLLAKEPIDLKAAGFEGARAVALAKSAEDAARQSKGSAGWLLVAVLHQSRGSQSQALAALDNARRAGLNADVRDWLAAELKKSPERLAQAGSK